MAQQVNSTVSRISPSLSEHSSCGGAWVAAAEARCVSSTLATRARLRPKYATSATMASPRGHHQRRSMDKPVNISINTLDMHHDESDQNQQMLGATYVQHECCHNNDAKKPVSQLKGTPLRWPLFTSESQEVQRYTTGATRNLFSENMENKVTPIKFVWESKLKRDIREPEDELRKNITATMTSPRDHHQRSMDKPINMSSSVIHLKEEFTRLQNKFFPECNKRIEKISDLINEFNNGYSLAIYVLHGAGPRCKETSIQLLFRLKKHLSEMCF